MKTLALLSILASTFAVGAQAETSAPSKLLNRYSFTLDARPVDGNYQNITIKKDEYGSYVANYRTISPGFGAPIEDTTEELGMSLQCEATHAARKLQVLFCAVDLRPADGALVELTLTRNEDGRYDAVLHRATYSNLISPALDETREVAFGLIRQN